MTLQVLLLLGLFIVSALLFVLTSLCFQSARYYALDLAADGRPWVDNTALISLCSLDSQSFQKSLFYFYLSRIFNLILPIPFVA